MDISDYLKDSNNFRKIRYVGFSMGVVVMLIGVAAAVVGIVSTNGIVGGIASGMLITGFLMFPITDINFPRSRSW